MKVLFVDDSEDNLNLYKIYFKSESDIEQVFTLDPREAVELINAGGFDHIFLDIEMPELDGFEVFEKVKDNKGSQKVHALTAHVDAETTMRIEEAGFDSIVTKPILKKTLLEKIRN